MTDENSESESDTEEKLKGEIRRWTLPTYRSFTGGVWKYDYKTASYLSDVINNKCDTCHWWSCMECLSPVVSSQPAARVSPVHAEADREVPDFGEGSDGAAGEETLWVFHSSCPPQGQGWSPIPARSHPAVSSQGKKQNKRSVIEAFSFFHHILKIVPAHFLFIFQLERSFKFMREAEDQLKVIPQFCFPDAKDWAPVDNFPRSVRARSLPQH